MKTKKEKTELVEFFCKTCNRVMNVREAGNHVGHEIEVKITEIHHWHPKTEFDMAVMLSEVTTIDISAFLELKPEFKEKFVTS